ncbi:hypothetical protein PJL18_01190 [Paenarthrobacter nicotinovorans]|nr:hypothetical protein [Paenarthrobacter nicotinovorans]
MNGLAMASSDMFLAMICFWVMNCEAVMATIITMLRTHTATALFPPLGSPCSSEADSGAPKMLDESNWTTCSWLMAPTPWPCLAFVEIPDNTWNRAKKNGIWINIGRQAEKGLVPCFLYSAICSCAMAWRES